MGKKKAPAAPAVVSDGDDFDDVIDPTPSWMLNRVRNLAYEMQRAEKGVKTAEAQVEFAKNDLAVIRDMLLPGVIRSSGFKSFGIENVGVVSVKNDVYGSLPSLDKKPTERATALAWLEANGHGGLIKRRLTALLPQDLPLTVSLQTIRDVVAMLAEHIKDDSERNEAMRFSEDNDEAGYYCEGCGCDVAPGQKVCSALECGGDKLPDLDKPAVPPVKTSLNTTLEGILGVIVPGAEVDTTLDVHANRLQAWGRKQVEAGHAGDLRMLGLTPVERANISQKGS